MAAAKMHQFQNHATECNIVFEGLVQSSMRAKLTVELLKYLTHQRGQIPVSYELVKRDYELDQQDLADRKVPKGRLAGRKKLEALKRLNAMTALIKMFKIIEELFSTVDPISEVLILFGATVVSPKEVYRLRFPTKCYDGKMLNWTNCRMALFQTLVTSDIFGTVKPCKPGTKVHVLVRASRDSAAPNLGMISKPSYRLSHRGKHFIFNFVCKGREIDPEISQLDASLNISGVEPFDYDSPVATVGGLNRPQFSPLPNATPVSKRTSKGKTFPGLQRKITRLESVEESPNHERQEEPGLDMLGDLLQETALPSPSRDSMLENARSSLNEDLASDMIWFLVPVTMLGFRDKTSKAA